jgi:hypothetical protein
MPTFTNDLGARRAQARQIIEQEYAYNPGRPLLAINTEANCIGSWDATRARFAIVCGYTLTGVWVSMPYELKVNGEFMPNTWEAIPEKVLRCVYCGACAEGIEITALVAGITDPICCTETREEARNR